MNITNEQLAYIAGFVDGEGSISIGVNWHKIKWAPFRQRRYHLRVTIAQNTKFILDEIQGFFGGCLKKIKNRNPEKHRQHYNLCIDCLKGEAFLKAIYPWLRIKKKQAEVAIKFQECVNSEISPAERREKGAKFKEKVEALNRA
jgi:hypothetical protein